MQPTQPIAVPRAVARIAGTAEVTPVWVNEVGGLTFRIEEAPDPRFVKWQPIDVDIDLTAEAARLGWARRWIVVPEVLDLDADDEGRWLVTKALPGDTAVGVRWKADPETAVPGIASGLRMLHDALPVGECPYSWAAEDRLAAKRSTLGAGLTLHQTPPGADRPNVASLLEELTDVPPIDRLVVCHGDACAPNTLLHDDGTVAGHMDMGSLGTADRWADLAVASMSLAWNYGPGWEDLFYDTYGVQRDPARERYYRLLWELY